MQHMLGYNKLGDDTKLEFELIYDNPSYQAMKELDLPMEKNLLKFRSICQRYYVNIINNVPRQSINLLLSHKTKNTTLTEAEKQEMLDYFFPNRTGAIEEETNNYRVQPGTGDELLLWRNHLIPKL